MNKEKGHIHPLTSFIYKAYEIFSDLGFVVAEGPEIEEEKYNFDALNIPVNHPARGMQDTFWLRQNVSQLTVDRKQSTKNYKSKKSELIKSDVSSQMSNVSRRLLRTHNTAVDARFLEKHEPPFRIISPGRVFRNEATDATHETQFYQIDGLVVEEGVHLGHLKWLLENFYKRLMGDQTEFRWRRSYFPFVEPGVELDIKWGDKWVEVVGAGLLHPNVFTFTGRDSKKWRGLAFGSTIDRLIMVKYGIPDIRLLYSGDLRFLKQF